MKTPILLQLNGLPDASRKHFLLSDPLARQAFISGDANFCRDKISLKFYTFD